MGDLLLCLDEPMSASLNLSKATRLRDTVFRIGSLRVEWITLALQTIASKHRDLGRISIDVPAYLTCIHVGPDIRQTVGEGIFGQWTDLDSLLVHLWESRSIRPSVIRTWRWGNGDVGDCVGCLLPEMVRRGVVDLVK